jgi:hypothetical protein
MVFTNLSLVANFLARQGWLCRSGSHAPLSDEVRQLILKEFSWPTDELADIVIQLERIPAKLSFGKT